MQNLPTILSSFWAAWLVYWLISAARSKPTLRRPGWIRLALLRLLIAITVIIIFRLPGVGLAHISVTPASPPLAWSGLLLTIAGLGLAVWARVYLGRNWGVPMAHKQNPELITSGPYAWVRHPIYSGIILATFGTALASGWLVLLVVVYITGYFVYAARTEERNLEHEFGEPYRKYKAKSKMLVPFLY
jgi:protein-S-isoprenylcysteine O-methyltransferase Ste14